MSKKIIALIPARMNSSRFYGKPINLINNKPMIFWVYKQVLKVKEIEEIYVVTPDDEIANVCTEYNIPCKLDHKQGTTAAQKLAYAIEEMDGDIYLNIQGDEPLINPLAIKQIVDEMLNNNDTYYAGLFSKIKTEEEFLNRNVVKTVIDQSCNAMYFSRSPIPNNFDPNVAKRVLGLYGYRNWFLKKYADIPKSELENSESGVEMLRMMEKGYKIKLLETIYETIGVDLPEHIPLIEAEMNKNNTKI